MPVTDGTKATNEPDMPIMRSILDDGVDSFSGLQILAVMAIRSTREIGAESNPTTDSVVGVGQVV